ncbi:pentatricopeptide repeat-containing protein At3g12770-like isoform X1 [Magnolia sinica]|uniref:pentatricopeptide repeat-containing protein At3g12770-like isoform X1 n=1 Tax=Magnolia sinica TaxID=86752 RepID=UPI00265B32CC|nr:pentatricopeptide repeat-containing protein At3g12770-like isoform X1 [Magnolia sinica]
MDINLPKTPLLTQVTLTKDPKAWNSIIRYHAKLKNDQAILKSFAAMEASGSPVNNSTLPLVLKACARLQAVKLGKKIHSDIQNTPLIKDVRVQTAFIDFYCKCGFFYYARRLFDEMTRRDLVSWNALISGYVGNSQYEDAIALFFRMRKENLEPNSITLVSLLSACAEMLELRLGQEIHCYCLRNGLFDLSVHVGTSLIGFYSRFDVRVSRWVFDSMVLKNLVSWNAMISGYCNAGEASEALKLFVQMLVIGIAPCSLTMLVLVQSCADLGYLKVGKQVHQFSIKSGLSSDIFIGSALIDLYAKVRSLESSSDVFENMPARDVASWNAMMHAYKDFGCYEKALDLFNRMQLEDMRGDVITFATMLSICAQCSSLRQGKCLHAYMIKIGPIRNVSIGNALLSMYANFDCMESAQKIFCKMHRLDVVSCNVLLAALVRNGSKIQAWELFKQMRQMGIEPNSFTLVSILAACKNQASLKTGQSIHSHAIRHGKEFNSSLHTALTDMYMDCGDEKTARCLFERSSDRDLISWNAMVACYVRSGRPNEALLLFQQMQSEVKPNLVTMINTLPSIAHLANLPQGRCMHAYIIRNFPLHLDVAPGNALLTMYAKCGSIHDAERVLQCLPRRDIVSYNAMIAGYGMHGRGKDALRVFSEMQEAGLRPTSVTFVSVLSACSHSGLVEKGQQLFQSMSWHYNVVPEIVHYACMVDLFGRAGLLDEARNFIDLMPMEPDASVWRALLGACRNFSNIELARVVSEKLIELEPMNIGNYILLSNIYAAAGNWDIVRKLRMQITEQGLRKAPGSSWVVIKTKVHCFVAGDRLHPQTDEIYSKLSCLMARVTEAGYVPDSSWVLHDLEDEEKDQRLFSHSEKLAISFGLLNVISGAPILVTKNLRVCGDCHTFIKLVSKVVGREIVLRDASRFHHFVDGICSCKDYW